MNRAEETLRDKLVKWGSIWAIWTGFAMMFALSMYLYRAQSGPRAWAPEMIVLYPLTTYWIWAGLTPIILYVWERAPLRWGSLKYSVPIHLLNGCFIAALHTLLRGLLYPIVNPRTMQMQEFTPETFKFIFLGTVYNNLWVYASVIAVVMVFEYHQKFRERELQTSQLQTQLVQAQLKMLRMQLNPHFLFNTLHNISALMHKDVHAAEQMLVRLSDMLRSTLENEGEPEVTLKQELEFLDNYLTIQQIRFGDRLKVEVNVDPGVLDAKVPNLLLQPIVENAVVHGIAPYTAQGRVEISAERRGPKLLLQVRDNGPGLADGEELIEGIGLRNTRERLQRMYGEFQRLEVENAPAGGLLVSIELPCRQEGAQESGVVLTYAENGRPTRHDPGSATHDAAQDQHSYR